MMTFQLFLFVFSCLRFTLFIFHSLNFRSTVSAVLLAVWRYIHIFTISSIYKCRYMSVNLNMNKYVHVQSTDNKFGYPVIGNKFLSLFAYLPIPVPCTMVCMSRLWYIFKTENHFNFIVHIFIPYSTHYSWYICSLSPFLKATS